MDTSPPDLRSLFAEALERPAGPEREAYLDEACRGDASLRCRVEALLRSHDEAGNFLAAPPTADAPAPDPGRPHAADEAADVPPRGPPAEGVGARIGPYKLLQEIGEGGMGTVYMAEQERPVRRHVALKVIKAGMDTAQVVARFEAERQALALMDHPSIAKVFDAGTTDSGRPFFVMELVKGVPITEYCDEARLTPKERLELFIPVCQAIQHAHQKGVIHRDVKPSNILVTLVDGSPVPKVIDFGVAKAVEQKLTERTLFTQFGAIVGTPEYMSPEQAGVAAGDVDTRSDIYSLGVLLYELLTGSTPLDRETLRQAAFAEILRRIREEEPPKPSTRLSGSGDHLASLSAVRHTEPGRLTKLVRGDLDWIVMRALEKDRSRRYETANGFARDVRRYLDGDAVEAGPPSARYRLGKFARKHRAGLATAGAFAVLLVAATAVSAVLAVRASRARDATAVALGESEQSRKEAEAVSEFLVDAFKSPDRTVDGSKLRVVELLDGAVQRLEADTKMAPAIKGRLLHVLGLTYRGLGQWLKSKGAMERAVEVRSGALGPDHRETLRSRVWLVVCSALAGGMDDAVALGRSTLAACESALGPGDELTILARSWLGCAYWWANRMDEAIPLAEATVRLCEGRYPEDSSVMVDNRGLLGEDYARAGRYEEALAQYQRCLAATERMVGPDHRDAIKYRSWIKGLIVMMGRGTATPFAEREAKLKRDLEKYGAGDFGAVIIRADLALQRYNETGQGDVLAPLEAVIAADRAEIGADHPHTLNWEKTLAEIRLDQGHVEEGVAALEGVVARFESKLPRGLPASIVARTGLAYTYQNYGRVPDSIRLFESIARDIAYLGPDNLQVLVADTGLANSYDLAGRWAEAIALMERTLARSGAKFGPRNLQTLAARFSLAAIRFHANADPGRRAEAIGQMETVARIEEEVLSKTDPIVVDCHVNLFDYYFMAGRLDRAEAEYDEWVPRLARPLDWEANDVQGWCSRRGELLLRRGRFAEAEPLIVKGYERMKAHEAWIYPIWKDRLPEAAERVVRLYEKWGKPEKAAEWRAKIKAGAPAKPAGPDPTIRDPTRPSHDPTPRHARLHADRAAGRHLHHRDADRATAAGRPGGPRGGAADAVRRQPQADRPGRAELPRRQRLLPDGRPVHGLPGSGRRRRPQLVRRNAPPTRTATPLQLLQLHPRHVL